MEERIKKALRRGWLLVAEECLGVSIKKMSGKAAREIAADQLQMNGGDKEAADAFYALGEKEQKRLMREALPEPYWC